MKLEIKFENGEVKYKVIKGEITVPNLIKVLTTIINNEVAILEEDEDLDTTLGKLMEE